MKSLGHRIANGMSIERVDYTQRADLKMTPTSHKLLDVAMKRLELKYGMRRQFIPEQVYPRKKAN